MDRGKCSSGSKYISNLNRITTACLRRSNPMSNELAGRTNPRKSNINWTFRKAKWPVVIP